MRRLLLVSTVEGFHCGVGLLLGRELRELGGTRSPLTFASDYRNNNLERYMYMYNVVCTKL